MADNHTHEDEKELLSVSPEVWSIIATGIVILISNATTYRSLRRELNERIADLRREMNERFAGLS